MILVIGPRLKGHSVISLAIQTHLSCRFLLAVVFPIADHLMPLVERKLAGDEDGANAIAVLEDFQEVAAGPGSRSPVPSRRG